MPIWYQARKDSHGPYIALWTLVDNPETEPILNVFARATSKNVLAQK